jgi:RNA polymerase sigma-70 factor (ECF subfamily)
MTLSRLKPVLRQAVRSLTTATLAKCFANHENEIHYHKQSQVHAMSSVDLSQHQAVQSLYQEHHHWLCGWLRKKLGCVDHAADLAQDTFIRVLTQRKAQELREPRAYLSTIARSLMIDTFRRRALEQAYLETLAARPEAVDISPETRLLILETLVEIDQLLDGLGGRTREIFLMAQLDGLSYVEIGRQLNVSVNTVKKHAVRALTHCLLAVEE